MLFRSILMTFFFEKIPGLRPKVISSISSPRDPRIARWEDLMKRLGGSEVPRTTWDDEFFQWWEKKVIVVEDYPCAGMDFLDNPDLVLPPGAAWGTIGKIEFVFNYMIFWIFPIYVKKRNMFLIGFKMTYNIMMTRI